MPDWSYHPLLKPIGAWLPAPTRRSLALGALGGVGAFPGGALLVDFLGDMKPDPSLSTAPYGRRLVSPIGIGGGVDPDGRAIAALGRFGVGFVEVGPYAVGAALTRREMPAPLTMGTEPQRLRVRLRSRPSWLSVWLRIVMVDGDFRAVADAARLLEAVAGSVDVVTATLLEQEAKPAGDGEGRGTWHLLQDICRRHDVATLLLDVPSNGALSSLRAAIDAGARGVVVRGPIQPEETIDVVLHRVRHALPDSALVVAGCGARSPREIVEAIGAGAALVALDQGFIESGPGLPKRGNAALASTVARAAEMPLGRSSTIGAGAAVRSGWLWLLLLGLGMSIAGATVLWTGLTSVLLPYDEAFLGVGRDALNGINPRLLGFMRHDRVTLAATLMSIGVLYAALAWYGVRLGRRWARDAVRASGVVGFASLFLFLGFHYIDPLHVVLTTGLLPLFVLGLLLPMQARPATSTDLDNDAVWWLGLAGQLLFIGLAVGLIGAGVTITSVGVTTVFVFSDLQFLQTTAAAIGGANAHLLPLIAHDRAGFGGALASDGVALLLLSLWGFQRGERWIWWTTLCAGLTGLAGAVSAHLAVGYLELGHLLPVGASAVVFSAALALSGPFLLIRRPTSGR